MNARTPRVLVLGSAGALLALSVTLVVVSMAFSGRLVRSGAGQLNVQEGRDAQTITVAGEGEVTVRPDLAYLGLGVQTQAETAAEAARQNARLLAAVVAKLKDMGIEDRDIQTSRLGISPVYSRGDPPQIVGYTVTNNVLATVRSIEMAGPILDAAIAAGANRSSGISFGVSEIASLRVQALAEAVRVAREKGDAIARAMDVSLTGTKAVVEESFAAPRPLAQPAFAAEARAAVPTPVQPGEQTVTSRVRVVYTY